MKVTRRWSGLCPAGKHGLDYEGQPCDLCPAPASPEAPAPAPFLLREFAALVDAVERAAFRYHASDTQARRDKFDAARFALLSAVGASVSAARAEGAALASRVSALEGALQECIEREYYDGQMDPARAALSAPAPDDCGCDEGGLCERHRVESHRCGEAGDYCDDSEAHRAIVCRCGSAAWVARTNPEGGALVLACARCAAPAPGDATAERCYVRSPLGAKCELPKGHVGAHAEEGWGEWYEAAPAAGSPDTKRGA